ncbi:MAG: AI-2E family transporter [Chloroflexota bacterium]
MSSALSRPRWSPTTKALVAIGLHVLFTQIDLNYLIPRIIGRRIQLHPLAIILGIIAGASVAGVLGIVLAAPAIATARVLVRYLFANLLDAEPFPEPQGIPG